MTFKESTFFRLLSRIRALIVLNTLRPFSVSLLSKFKTEIYLPDRRSSLPDSRGFAPQIGDGFEKDLLERAARSAGASAVMFA
jgi:hypothetical protein